MQTDAAALALIESLRLINTNLEKVTSRIEILESDYKERFIKKQLFRWLMTLYPIVMVVLIWMVDTDHKKIAEIAGDIKELINDTSSLTIVHQKYGESD